MTELNLLNVAQNLRLDVPDTEFLISSVAKYSRAMISSIIASSNRVLAGFSVSLPNNYTVRVSRSSGAFIGYDDAAVDDGQLMNQGQTSADVDFTLLATGNTYKIWVRVTKTTGQQDNRAFWDPGTDQEFTALHDTRVLFDWEATASVASPGAEWVELAEVVWDGAISLADVTDSRTVVFEGPLKAIQSTSGLPDYNRSSDRSANHLKDAEAFVAAVLREVQDIKSNYHDRDGSASGHAWYTALPTGLSLRSAQDVVATVGDGVNSFGNYNIDDPTYAGDAGAAIKAAVDAAAAAGGGLVVVKPGDYEFQTTVAWPTSAHVAVQGHGVGVTKCSWIAGKPSQPFFRFQPTAADARMALSGMTLEFVDNAGDTTFLDVNLSSLSAVDADRVAVSKVRFYTSDADGEGHTGIVVANGSGSQRLKELLVEQCDFDSVETTVSGDRIIERTMVRGCRSSAVSSRLGVFTDCQNVMLEGCAWTGKASTNPALAIESGTTRVRIAGCVITNGGITLSGADDVVINGNLVESTGSFRSPIAQSDSNRVIISGNWLLAPAGSQCYVATAPTNYSGLDFVQNVCLSHNRGIVIAAGSRGVNVRVAGNLLAEQTYGSAAPLTSAIGISLSNCPGAVVSGNAVYRVGETGIFVSNCSGSAIEGNIVLDDDLGGGEDVADRVVITGIRSSSGQSRIQNNVVRGTTSRGLWVTGVESLVQGNLVYNVDGGSVEGAVDLTNSNIAAIGNYVLDCTGFGFRLAADNIHISGCIADNPSGVGFVFDTVDQCRAIGCEAVSPGTVGFDVTGKGTVLNKLDSCMAYICTKGFEVVGWAQLANCSVFAPSDDAFYISEDAVADLANCVVDGAQGLSAVTCGNNSQFTITGGRFIVDSGSPATTVITVSFGAQGSITGCYCKGDNSMSGAAITVANTAGTRVNISGVTVEDWGTHGIRAGYHTNISACVIQGGTTGVCVEFPGAGVLSGCSLFPPANQVSVLVTSAAQFTPIIQGNRIIDATLNVDHINITGAGGAVVIGNFTNVSGDINFNATGSPVAVGNRGFDIENPASGSGIAANV